MELTRSELEIMNVIWDAGRPLTRGEILDRSVDKTWKDNSIHILLNRLLAKGALVENGFARSGKSYGRLYEAAISGEAYYAQSLFAGGNGRTRLLFDALLDSAELDGQMIDEFLEKLQKKKKALS